MKKVLFIAAVSIGVFSCNDPKVKEDLEKLKQDHAQLRKDHETLRSDYSNLLKDASKAELDKEDAIEGGAMD